MATSSRSSSSSSSTPWPSLWTLGLLATTLLLSMGPPPVDGAAAGNPAGPVVVYRVVKTEATVQLGKRDESCPASYSLCPAAQGGGCCTAGYSCGADACYKSALGPVTACNLANYFACPLDVGGGCCPLGYTCNDAQNCLVPPGTNETSLSCPTGYNACGKEFNFGCCPNGMACAVNNCYATAPSTLLVAVTLTSTDASSSVRTTTVYSTSVSTPIPPRDTAPLNTAEYSAKVFPSTVPKISSVTTSGGGGLSPAQIGGIVGGAVGLLLIVIIVACVILRKLSKVSRQLESSQAGGSSAKSGNPNGGGPKRRRFTNSEVDAMSVDPLNVGTRSSTVRLAVVGGVKQPDRSKSGSSEVGTDYSSSQGTTPHAGHGVSAPHSPPPPSGGAVRASIDSSSSPPAQHAGSYFDFNPRHHGPRTPSQSGASFAGGRRQSTESSARGGRHAHERQYSGQAASEVSADGAVLALSSQPPVELADTTVYPELPATPIDPARAAQQQQQLLQQQHAAHHSASSGFGSWFHRNSSAASSMRSHHSRRPSAGTVGSASANLLGGGVVLPPPGMVPSPATVASSPAPTPPPAAPYTYTTDVAATAATIGTPPTPATPPTLHTASPLVGGGGSPHMGAMTVSPIVGGAGSGSPAMGGAGGGGQYHNQGGGGGPSTGGGPQLAVVSESPEIIGFYGPAGRHLGQTAAGLGRRDAKDSP